MIQGWGKNNAKINGKVSQLAVDDIINLVEITLVYGMKEIVLFLRRYNNGEKTTRKSKGKFQN